MKNTFVAVLGKKSLGLRVVGYIVNPPEGLKSITLACGYTSTGDAVYCSSYKVSRSVRNVALAMRTQPVSFHSESGTWTFRSVD